jgi:thioredoxin reductase
LEAALQLANPSLKNRVTLLVRSKSFNRANQENIEAVNALALQGKIWILFESSISSIHPTHIMVDYGGSQMKLNNSYVFIFAGAEIPSAFLKGLGIKMEKKFGERLQRK